MRKRKEESIIMQDNPNDWLTQEKKREGYRAGKTSAEIAHEEEEVTRGWFSGARYNAREHQEEHSKIHGSSSFEYSTSGNRKTKTEGTQSNAVALVTNVFILFALGFSSAIFAEFLNIPNVHIPILFLFLSINPGVIFWVLIGKKIPPVWYFRICLMITFLLYIYFFAVGNGLIPFFLY